MSAAKTINPLAGAISVVDGMDRVESVIRGAVEISTKSIVATLRGEMTEYQVLTSVNHLKQAGRIVDKRRSMRATWRLAGDERPIPEPERLAFSAVELKLFGFIGSDWKSRKQVCRDAGLAESTVRKALSRLEKVGAVERADNGPGSPRNTRYLYRRSVKSLSDVASLKGVR